MGSQFAPAEYMVLVVDGDGDARLRLTTLLERAGYRTRAFDSGEALLRALAAYPAKVCVIAEAELPDMSGLDLIARLRGADSRAPIVILTRLPDVSTAVRAMRASVADYLVKPYVERDLIDRLRTVLTRPRAVTH